MHADFPALSLLLITGLAAFVPLLIRRLRRLHLPIVVGEILAGIIVGQSGLNLIESGPELDFLAEFGFAYLMFLSGLEIEFSLLRSSPQSESQHRRLDNPLSLGLATLAITMGAGLLASQGLAQLGLVQNPLMMALIFSTTSLGIVVPVLKEHGLTGTRYGQTLLVSALVADFITLLLITVVAAASSRGLTLHPLLVLFLLAAFAATAWLSQRVADLPGLHRVLEELSHATAQIRVRGALALMVAFIALADWLGTEVILGSFLAGAVISLLSEREGSYLHLKLDAIGFGFFIPIFFITVGMRFDLPALLSSSQALLLVPSLLGAAYAVKLLAATLYRLHFSWRRT